MPKELLPTVSKAHRVALSEQRLCPPNVQAHPRPKAARDVPQPVRRHPSAIPETAVHLCGSPRTEVLDHHEEHWSPRRQRKASLLCGSAVGLTILPFSGERERERSDRPVRPLQRRVSRPDEQSGQGKTNGFTDRRRRSRTTAPAPKSRSLRARADRGGRKKV